LRLTGEAVARKDANRLAETNQEKEKTLVESFAIIPAGLWVLWFAYHIPKAAHELYLEEAEKRIAENEVNESVIKTLKGHLHPDFIMFPVQCQTHARKAWMMRMTTAAILFPMPQTMSLPSLS
jgi:hypothetical protein